MDEYEEVMDDLPAPSEEQEDTEGSAPLSNLGARLQGMFTEFEDARSNIEDEWLRDLRQYNAMYERDVLEKLDPNRSRVYIGLTRTKVMAAYSRMIDLLFQRGERFFSFTPTPVANIDPMQEAKIKQQALMEIMQVAGEAYPDLIAARKNEIRKAIQSEINEDAAIAAAEMETEVEDQLVEANAEQMLKEALMELVIYGSGCVKAGGTRVDRRKRYGRGEDGSYVMLYEEVPKPDIESVSIFDCYPDPYATSMDGTVASVSSLTRDDLLAAHEAVFARDRLYVGAVGDITPEALGALLDELLADLPAEGAPMPPVAEVTIDGGITVVPFDTPQSVAIFGHTGIAQEDPDFFAASVLNQVLGGGSFESRLMQEVREKRGLTYGVYSYLAPRDHAAVYLGQVASANERIAETISVIRAEWGKAAREGVSAKEVADAKTYMTGAYPLRFDGNEPIARIMVGMQMLGLPIDYIPTRNDRVEAVTLDDVNRVAAELLDPEALHFVVVGQPEGLETGPLPTPK